MASHLYQLRTGLSVVGEMGFWIDPATYWLERNQPQSLFHKQSVLIFITIILIISYSFFVSATSDTQNNNTTIRVEDVDQSPINGFATYAFPMSFSRDRASETQFQLRCAEKKKKRGNPDF